MSRAAARLATVAGQVTAVASAALDEKSLAEPRFVPLGSYVVAEGERVEVVGSTGTIKYYDGPRWLLLWRSSVRQLPRVTAESSQALRVRLHDGSVEQLLGPAQLWFEPLRHRSVELVEPISLVQGETLVSYTSDAEAKVQQRIVMGPALHLPGATEWNHTFRWTGQDPKDPHNNAKKVAGRLVFDKLRTTPQQLYFDVVDARTSDDAVITCKLMIFYELVDIAKMLLVTNDPIADIINSVTADVIEFVATKSFEAFKLQSVALNALETFRHLTLRSSDIGFKVSKVVFRGYLAGANLQSMHDNAIEQRTKLVLARETAEKQEELADFELQRKTQRAAMERTEEQAQQQHGMQLKDAESRAGLVRAEEAHASVLKQQEQKDAHELAHLQGLVSIGVDPTRYTVAAAQGTPTQLYTFEGMTPSQLHIEPSSTR